MEGARCGERHPRNRQNGEMEGARRGNQHPRNDWLFKIAYNPGNLANRPVNTANRFIRQVADQKPGKLYQLSGLIIRSILEYFQMWLTCIILNPLFCGCARISCRSSHLRECRISRCDRHWNTRQGLLSCIRRAEAPDHTSP